MLLSDLFAKIAPEMTFTGSANRLITDSRNVSQGDVFIAIKGTTQDGHDYINDAVKAGAVAVVAEADCDTGKTPLVKTGNSRLALSKLAAIMSGRQPGVIAAVTGTNGKTSVAEFLRQIWAFTGWTSASMGTLGLRGDGLEQIANMSNLTTPDAINLHQNLAAIAKKGVTNLAIEASSHGIEQDRLSGMHIAAAGFTNLSRDHLDHHETMENYFDAKARLFTEILPDGAMAVINIDDEHGMALVKRLKKSQIGILKIGCHKDADLKINSIEAYDGGMTLKVSYQGIDHTIPLALVGNFQAENALIAAGLAHAVGLSMAHALLALPYLVAAQGRMQSIPGLPSGGKVVVDFAHTPDALETTLTTLRQDTKGKLGVVFGCGGDRDEGKRAEMGAIAHSHADFTIITDDNPRSEDPAAIRAMIASACPDAENIGDRHKAIRHGIAQIGADDVLLIAGKGHESNQLIGVETLPFNDESEAAGIISSLKSQSTRGQAAKRGRS